MPKLNTCLAGFWRPALATLALCLLSGLALGEGVVVVTGEYSPFVTQDLPEDGITAAIVSAALKTQGYSAKYVFAPWKRGYYDASLGKYMGTFPYLKIPEREVEFLYSDPVYSDHFVLFVREQVQKITWQGKAICIPLGYDDTQLHAFFAEHQLQLVRPATLDSCFRMLDAQRIDAVWASALVGADATIKLFGRQSHIVQLDLNFDVNSQYYFIVSRRFPQAEHWLATFNAGLKAIQTDGTYQKILDRFGGQ